MNFNVDELIKELGLPEKDGLNTLDFMAMSLIFKNGHSILCWYYQIDDYRAIIGLPFRTFVDDNGVLGKIFKYDLFSDEPYYIIDIDSIQSVSYMSEDWFETFQGLCQRLLVDEDDEEPPKEDKVLH